MHGSTRIEQLFETPLFHSELRLLESCISESNFSIFNKRQKNCPQDCSHNPFQLTNIFRGVAAVLHETRYSPVCAAILECFAILDMA